MDNKTGPLFDSTYICYIHCPDLHSLSQLIDQISMKYYLITRNPYI